MGTTTCAVALAAAHERAFVLDLALAMGDAADVAGAHVAVPDALLRIACGPVTTPAELAAGLALGDACRVLPAPPLPEHADLIDEHGIARVLDLAVGRADCARSSTAARAWASRRFPVLERASVIAIVASADARGARGARRTSLLLARLGLAGRALGIVATRARNARSARARWPKKRACRCSRSSSRTRACRALASADCRRPARRSPRSRALAGAPAA